MLLPEDGAGGAGDQTITDDLGMPGGEAVVIPEGHWGGDETLYEGMGEESKAAAQKLAIRFDTPAKAMAAHLSAHQMRGQSILLPKADASPEDKAAVHRKIFTKMGCPEDANNYASPAAEDIPEGFAIDDEKMTALKQMAFEEGLSQGAFQRVFATHMAAVVELKQQFKADAEAATKEKTDLERGEWDEALSVLQKEWGASFDERIAHAKKWAEAKWANKETRMRFAYQMYVKDFAEGKLMEGSGQTVATKGIFDSHEGE